MTGKIDFIIPIHRGELAKPERIKRRLDFIEALGDTEGMTYTILGTYSEPELTVEEIRAVAPSPFYQVLVAPNADYDTIAQRYGFKIKQHYYPITSVTWEWIIQHMDQLRHGEAFHVFHVNDMHPMAFRWAQMIYQGWCGVAKPFIYGEWWYGGVYGPGPFIDGLYNWEWHRYERKWGGWGAYDAELPYIAWNHGLSVVPSLKTAGILTHNFLRRLAPPLVGTEDLNWIDETFNTWLAIFHNFEDKWWHQDRYDSDRTFQRILDVYARVKAQS